MYEALSRHSENESFLCVRKWRWQLVEDLGLSSLLPSLISSERQNIQWGITPHTEQVNKNYKSWEVRSCSTTLLISCSYLVLLLKHRPRWLFLAYNSGFHACFFFSLVMWNLIKILPVQLVLISIEDKNSKAQVFVSVPQNEPVFLSLLLLIVNSHTERNLSLWDTYLLFHWQ